METKFNKKLTNRRFRRLRNDWQEKLPVRALGIAVAVIAALILLILINLPRSFYLDDAEVEILRARDILRIGVDTSVFGLSNNGEGLEIEMVKALSKAVFGAEDACEAVETTRQTVQRNFVDGKIDLAIMSFPSLSGYSASKLPFYIDSVVLMGFSAPASLNGKRIGVLYNTPAEKVLKNYIKSVMPGAEAVSYAAYYDMLVALRAGTVDLVCMTRTAALSHKTGGLVILPQTLGTVEYHIITENTEVTLRSVTDALLSEWIENGTLGQWYKQFRLTY